MDWFRWFVIGAVLLAVLLVAGFSPAHAQLAQSFINVTGITVKTLPNAVQVRIETDGSVQFGGDASDWVDFSNGWTPKPTQSLRLRIVRARAKLPAFVPIETYPVDGAVVTLGREDFSNPQFSNGAWDQAEPRVQVELRFAAPIIVRTFSPDTYNSISFGNYLGPLEALVETSSDRRAIVVTVITNRADATAPQRLNRSPRSERKQNLVVTPLPEGKFHLEALHSPLRDVLHDIEQVTNTQFLAREEVTLLDVSLVLPSGTVADFLDALQNGYGVGFREENGIILLGRGDEFFTSASLPLKNLTPGKARLLFPDFLLPYLRADIANNALLAVGTPQLVDKIRTDLANLDLPRPEFEIKASVWEVADTKDVNKTLQLARSIGGDVESVDSLTGEASFQVASGLTSHLSTTLEALSSKGKAKLLSAPYVTALSGEQGTLFLGQTRYIKILQNRYGGQTAQAQALQVGTQIVVTPRGNNLSGDVLLDIAPRVSTIDAIENETGLPTVGIREMTSTLRVRPGESVVLAGLDSDLESHVGDQTFKIFPARRESRERRELLVVVTARRLPS